MNKLFSIVCFLSKFFFSISAVAYEKSDLAEMQSLAVAGDLKGQFSYAYHLEDKDHSRAMSWFVRADEHGDPLCEFFVYKMLRDSDFDEALTWLKKAADHGFSSAMNELGLNIKRHTNERYTDVNIVKANYLEAASWFRKASDAGNDEASYNLGVMYLEGVGVPTDIEQATSLLRKSGYKGLQLLKSKGLMP